MIRVIADDLGTFAVKDDNPKSNKLDQFLLKKQYGDLDDEFIAYE